MDIIQQKPLNYIVCRWYKLIISEPCLMDFERNMNNK